MPYSCGSRRTSASLGVVAVAGLVSSFVADEEPPVTPERARKAFQVFLSCTQEDRDAAANALLQAISHPLSGRMSISVTMGGSLSGGIAHHREATDSLGIQDSITVPVPAAVLEEATRSVDNAKTALAVLLVWLGWLQASSGLAEESIADFYGGMALSLPALFYLLSEAPGEQ